MALKKLIGEILSDLGVVSPAQVEEALRRQKEIFEGRTLPDRVERSRLVAEARASGISERIPLLGQILAEMGVVSESQLTEALNVQGEMIRKFCDLECDALCSVMDMGNRVNSSLNLLEVLSMIMHNACRVTDSMASTLMLVDEKSGDLFFSVPTGPKAESLVDLRLKKGQGIAGWVAQHQRPLIVDDVASDPRFYPGVDEMSGFSTKSILAVPLKAKSKIIGVLEVLNKEDGSSFSEEDVLLLTIFSEQAAMAIENARLYEELKKQIAETRRVQEQLAEVRKFQALSQLSSGLSHDFKNILNAIMGFAEIILLDVENAQIREDVEEILKAGTRAKDLLAQILNFTRQSEQNRIPIESSTLIHQAIKSIRSDVSEEIEIIEDLSREEIRFTADPSQIHQVLSDILKNATEAIGSAPGTIRIETSPVHIDAEQQGAMLELRPGDYLRIRISDNGCGMDEKTLKRIFEPYFSTKERGVGTGMSLAAVQGIVKGHDGAVTVASAPGEGATFDLYFPYQPGHQHEEPAPSQHGLPRGKERILVVDDEAPLVTILERMLGHLGYEVHSTTRPESALEMFTNSPDSFDLVVTDLAMPGMPGDMLAERMMKIRPDIRIIIWTAFSEGINREKMTELGIMDCLDKPVIMSDLATTVRRVLDWRQ
ncbi:MAG: response regulator [Desulfobacterales bacterium]